MKISLNNGVPTPQAHVAINKSRLKVYNKNSNSPTFYLQKGQEFQLELFNPTTGTVLAKIFLNGNAISQGGLVLRPGERVFLDRYIDVPKKFLFDTYEVSNNDEVKKAIEDNGDFKVEFYKEFTIQTYPIIGGLRTMVFEDYIYPNIGTTTISDNTQCTNLNYDNSTNYSTTLGLTTNSLTTNQTNFSTSSIGQNKRRLVKQSKSDSIETGRVEKGSTSNQKLTTVNMSWEIFPFHTVEYKLLPVSQKINTTGDIMIKRYCTNCGSKLGKTHKFCANCGAKA
jgi:hypothetical protein